MTNCRTFFLFGLVLAFSLTTGIFEPALAGNWNKSKKNNVTNEAGIPGELAAQKGNCRSSDVECLNIGDYKVRFSGKLHKDVPNVLSFFAGRNKSFSCPQGYRLKKEAGMVIDNLYISTCENGSASSIAADIRKPTRLKFFKGKYCPSPYGGMLYTQAIVGCL